MKTVKQQTMTAMQLAFAKSGYKVRTKRTAWPRVKGPKFVRIDCATGNAVSFVN